MEILILILSVIILFFILQNIELTKFKVTEYQIVSPKIKEPAKAAVLADLHGYTYGEKNVRLLRRIQELNPDVILIAGDMIVSKYTDTYEIALDLLEELVRIAPVYYGYGNHESRLCNRETANHMHFLNYLYQSEQAGVTIMETESREILIGKNPVMLSALELELEYYEKGRTKSMVSDYMESRLPMKHGELFQILLAHNPAYAKEYIKWGADVTFCGHNHGGLIRIPGIGSVISPQFSLFPKYDNGIYKDGDKYVITSRGLGTHTFHIRIFNRAELLSVRFLPEKNLEKTLK